MAVYHDARCRLCRREGMKLFLKGQRCFSDKCAFERRGYAPGEHGKSRRIKETNYGQQLREKQKARRIYGVLETQFRNNFEKATMMKGIAGDNMLALLERRLDNVVYRMGLGTSRAQARQIVRHGHIQVNGRKVNIPSALVKPEDVVEVRQSSKENPTILLARDTTAHAPAPGWMEVDKDALRARITGMPRRDELVQIQLNEQLIVELYSK